MTMPSIGDASCKDKQVSTGVSMTCMTCCTATAHESREQRSNKEVHVASSERHGSRNHGMNMCVRKRRLGPGAPRNEEANLN